ncbi:MULTISPECIES: TfoX/Sxy family protein [Kordiimonas]|mgnify:CR=1 FL=1|jgi:TfoX/Sxy family transcriptional regulator of competence genes|uniref:TfoX N-terminal domain-containing protein n=1 Tax=Kordiimonas lacus TaxID=637679 RepID=A0A1G6YQ24_9PROT|nr:MULTISPECIES: TfoX/Sxy family protein [Kordiimonas]SDD92604.1 TfoX N-terminal domain-containing protein [Kordiimonas lacus]
MAYDEQLAGRVRHVLDGLPEVVEKKMFGGLCFMVAGHMCCGIVDTRLMARVGPEAYEDALKDPHARPMDFTGKPMKGMIYVQPDGTADTTALEAWVNRCLSFSLSLPPK